MRLLVLSSYDRLGASSRLRIIQYFDNLERAGVAVCLEPFFQDSYLERLYSGRPILPEVLGAYWRRIRRLLHTHSPDAIWLEKEVLPWLPYGMERLLLPYGIPVVSDYDDAVFHRYDRHRLSLVRRVLGHKIDRAMTGSALVMAGNAYLAERARHAGATRVEIVPTVVDVMSYNPLPLPEADGRPRIGWIGTPSTWKEYLLPMLPMLRELASHYGAVIRNVGGNPSLTSDEFLENLPWSEDDEGRLIQGMDIGLMPLNDSPWARGKCGYKLIQYMACGLPVIASPVGVNTEIVEHGVNGFLATSDTEWRQALEILLTNPELRKSMGAEGRRKVEEKYSLQVWGPRVAGMLREVAEAGQR